MNMINERIIQLGAAHECMVQAIDIMEQMELTKHMIERISYESINAADKALNLSKEGTQRVDTINKIFSTYLNSLPEAEQKSISSHLKELTTLLQDIQQAAAEENASLHLIEKEVACQWDLTEDLRDKLGVAFDHINCATACDEMLFAMEV